MLLNTAISCYVLQLISFCGLVNIISNASLKPKEILVETNKHTYTQDMEKKKKKKKKKKKRKKKKEKKTKTKQNIENGMREITYMG
jgi:mannitol-specific phosphotransferase system IIBC component